MTGHCSKNITPDSITGMIFAMEGIKNTVVLLNGPMGCKFYHSTTSQVLALRPPLYLSAAEGGEKAPVDYNFLNDWFFRQSRVPSTYLDGYDYVYGTKEKAAEGLRYLKENVGFDLLVIVNSPGASLIGDHLLETAREIIGSRPVVMLESPGYSGSFCDGYQEAILALLRQVLLPEREQKESREAAGQEEKKREGQRQQENGRGGKENGSAKSVNLLGMSIWQRYWEGDLAELKRLFSLCGIQVNCCPGAGSSLAELRRLPEADLNVVLYPEMSRKTGELLREAWDMPCYVCPGPPVGFDGVIRMFEEIGRILETDISPLREACDRARALAWNKIDGIYQMCGLPDGCTFAIEGDSSVVYAYSRFFMEYLGMMPDCLSLTGGKDAEVSEMLRQLLDEYGAGSPEKKEILDTRAELVFGEANTIAALKTRNRAFCGIEISQPGMGYTDVLPKTQLGVTGSLFLIEQVLNGLMSKL